MKKLLPITLISFLLVIFSCDANKDDASSDDNNIDTTTVDNQNNSIYEDVFDFDVEFTNYTVKANAPEQITTDRGTVLNIPDNAFVDKNGNDVTEDVTVMFREIVTPGDIISSNMDMTYDSAGVTGVFETAGMFEIRAFAGAEELDLKQGKEIGVDFVSTQPGQFNFYRYNDDQQNWNYQTTSTVAEQAPTQHAFTPIKPVKVDPYNDYLIQLDIDYSTIVELKMYKNIIWKYTGSLTPDEVGQIVTKQFQSNSIEKSNGQFYAVLNEPDGTQHKLKVAPAFTDVNFNTAMDQYNAAVNSNTQQSPVRSNGVASLGVYNYDILYHRSSSVTLTANFSVNGENIDNMTLFQVTNGDNSVIRNQVKNNFEFMYDPTWSNKMIGVLPNGLIVYMTQDDFNSQVQNMSGSGTFDLKEHTEPLTSSNDLNNFISNL